MSAFVDFVMTVLILVVCGLISGCGFTAFMRFFKRGDYFASGFMIAAIVMVLSIVASVGLGM